MHKIILTQGKVAIVDNDDYESFGLFKWSFSGYCGRDHGYAVRRVNGRTLLLHRLIMSCPDGMEVDHINGDTMDCRKINLRICTRSDNRRNRSINKNNNSGFKGVSWHKTNKAWISNIRVDRKRIYLGSFSGKIEAAKAYDMAAKKYHGAFARLNFV